jgi:NADPH:quinone reductase
MKTIQFRDYGSAFEVVEVPTPQLERGQVLVKMAVASINPRDIDVRNGFLRNIPPPVGTSSNIVGIEGSGTVVDSKDDQQTYPIGTSVFFRQAYHLPHGGTWQEYVVATPQDLISLPPDKDMFEASAIRIPYQTALVGLEKGGFQPGEEAEQAVLAPAVGGAVGNAAIQLVRAYGVQEPVTTAGSAAKAERAQALGYSKVIDLSRESIRDGVMRFTDGVGVDIVLDMLGGGYTGQFLSVLKPGKALVVCGFSAGAQANISIPELMGMSKQIYSFNLLATPPALRASALKSVLGLWQENRIRPLIDRVFPFTEAEQAQRYLREARPLGRVLLTFE